jgi:thiol:disulfide interchange protein DsbD
VGLGLAFPYLILSWQPQWLKFLPKPGVWMERFKIAMGFPMLATALWLFTLTAPSFGKQGAWGLAFFLVTLGMAAWIWGQFVQRGTKRRGLAISFAIGFLVVGYAYGMEDQMNWRRPAKRSGAALKESAEGIDWQPWSATAVEKARQDGHPVLVDFTADWCLTCQANKKSSIEISSVRKKLKDIDAIAFLADNTDPDAAIAAELRRYDRAGVPLVLVYPKNPEASAIILPVLLRPGIVLEALERAAK